MGCFDILTATDRSENPYTTDGDITPRALLIQVTSDGNHAARVHKVRDGVEAWRRFHEARVGIEVWSFGLKGKRGQPKVWTLRREVVEP